MAIHARAGGEIVIWIVLRKVFQMVDALTVNAYASSFWTCDKIPTYDERRKMKKTFTDTLYGGVSLRIGAKVLTEDEAGVTSAECLRIVDEGDAEAPLFGIHAMNYPIRLEFCDSLAILAPGKWTWQTARSSPKKESA